MLPDGTDDIAAAYRWMWLAIITLGIGALVAWRRAGRIGDDDPGARAHGRFIRRGIRNGALLFAAGLLLSPTAAGIFVQAAAIIWYLHYYAAGSVLADDRLPPS